MYDPKGEMIGFNSLDDMHAARKKLTPQQKKERPTFEKGEVVFLKGAPFRVMSLGNKLVTLRPLPR